MFTYDFSNFKPEKDYQPRGALEIEMVAREREKKLALLTAEIAAESAEAEKYYQPNWLMTFITGLFSGSHTSRRQPASVAQK